MIAPAATVHGCALGAWPVVRPITTTGRPTEVMLCVTDHAGRRWTTTGPCDAPTAASRAGPRPPTPLWSSLTGPDGAVFVVAAPSPLDVRISTQQEGDTRVLQTHVRPTASEVTVEEVETSAFRGVSVLGRHEGPGIVLLGGAEGGTGGALPHALALADLGWSCLVVAYYGVDGTPTTLSRVPLEPVVAGVDWLTDHPAVGNAKIALWGVSKGAEAALVARSLSERVAAVVSVSGSPVIFEGLDHRTRESSWTWQGEALPFVPLKRLRALLAFARPSTPVTLRPVYGRGPGALGKGNAAARHIGASTTPTLLIAGADDRFWPADEMAREAADYYGEIEALVLPDAGHLLTVPGIPPVRQVGCRPALRAGGGSAGTVAAQNVAWRRTINFLRAVQVPAAEPSDLSDS